MARGLQIAKFLSIRRFSKRNLNESLSSFTNGSSTAAVDPVEDDVTETPMTPTRTTTNNTVPAQRTPDENVVAQFFRLMNKQQMKDIVTDCCAPSATIVFHSISMSTSMNEFCCEMESVLRSFPDYNITFATIEEVAPGRVLVQSAVASGRHTGPAYGFGPFPAVEKTHRQVCNDPETYEFQLDERRRIVHCSVSCCGRGVLSGPAGFYEQIGGFPCL